MRTFFIILVIVGLLPFSAYGQDPPVQVVEAGYDEKSREIYFIIENLTSYLLFFTKDRAEFAYMFDQALMEEGKRYEEVTTYTARIKDKDGNILYTWSFWPYRPTAHGAPLSFLVPCTDKTVTISGKTFIHPISLNHLIKEEGLEGTACLLEVDLHLKLYRDVNEPPYIRPLFYDKIYHNIFVKPLVE